jgi:AP-1 complex subunit sigma 1/2
MSTSVIIFRYFGNVCELDIIFNFHKAYYILDELFIGGNLQETSKAEVLRICAAMDEMMDESKEEGTTPGRGSSASASSSQAGGKGGSK